MARSNQRGRKLYRSRSGLIFGVCKGIAEWRDMSVDLVRIAFVVLNIVGFLPVWIYFILALVLPAEPETQSGRRGREDVDAEFKDLKDRVRDLEDEEFDKEKDWDHRFRKDP